MLTNEQIKFFQDIKINNKLSHLYLLFSSNLNVIENDLRDIFCIFNNVKKHFISYTDFPNVLLIDNGDEKIKKEELEEVFIKSQLFNFPNQRIFVIIKNIENASVQGLNSILKSIEEPSSNITIILTTTKLHALLDTIVSRSYLISLKEPNTQILFNKLKKQNLFNEKSELLGHIFNDEKLIAEFMQSENFKKIINLIKVLSDSIKNKHLLYAYLTKFLQEETPLINKLLVSGMIFIFSATYKKVKFEFNLGISVLSLSKELKNQKPKLINAITFLDTFSKATQSSRNFNLVKEKLLINLMELYE
ncbi:DNA polymerase III subunit delta' [Mycoplasmopsis citelli]|uniref:DNA polymerase III subunit delta n=1 Tax=Mycoplasmopsis citelli TaxID=171281 RepID=A0A449B356_9BACT|nr:hypothetical protein [Mycoplasmopsis citelli]VEU75028.1 DNA polymerase III subunit delta' [Mycoplasmopsis citelli]